MTKKRVKCLTRQEPNQESSITDRIKNIPNNEQNIWNGIDQKNYNEIITNAVANGASADKIRSLQSKQAMQLMARAVREPQEMNFPSGMSRTNYQDIIQILEKMKKYYHVQYAEFLDSKYRIEILKESAFLRVIKCVSEVHAAPQSV